LARITGNAFPDFTIAVCIYLIAVERWDTFDSRI